MSAEAITDGRNIECAVCGGGFSLHQTRIVKNAGGRPERVCVECSKGKPVVESEWPEQLTIIRYNDGGFSVTQSVPPDGAKFTHIYHRER